MAYIFESLMHWVIGLLLISFWPIYIGTGYNYIQEKNNVLEFSGDGSISSFSFYVGTRLRAILKKDFSQISARILTRAQDNMELLNLLLKKNNSDREYNFSNFYYSVGAYYYIF